MCAVRSTSRHLSAALVGLAAVITTTQISVAREDTLAALVARYREGATEAAVTSLATWPRRRLEQERGSVVQGLPAAAMLHTETGMRLWWDSRRDDAHLHFDAARSRVATSSDAAFRRRWALTMAAFFQAQMNLTEARSYVEIAAEEYRDHPDVLVAGGMLSEASTSPLAGPSYLLPFYRPDQTSSLNRTVGLRRLHLEDAERAYRRALAQDADHDEAQLRLGRVLGLLGNTGEATALLDRVGERSGDVYVRYLARLFVSRIREEAGAIEEAERTYRQAAAMLPGGQAAQLGSALQSFRRGDRTKAATVLRAALGAGTAPRADPWWLYDRGYASKLTDWLGELRMAARR